MKKVRFDTSGAIALQLKLGCSLTPDQRKPRKVEGWLIGDHICVQKPRGRLRGWCLSLYPWGDRLTLEFFSMADAIECATEINDLGLPWNDIRTFDISSDEYRRHIDKILTIRGVYEIDGLVMPDPDI